MTSQSVFLAAFLACTLGWVVLQIFTLTVVTPLTKKGRAWIKAHAREGRAGGILEPCSCCKCGDEHDAIVDNGKPVK